LTLAFTEEQDAEARAQLVVVVVVVLEQNKGRRGYVPR
jgi:hypothetical protein